MAPQVEEQRAISTLHEAGGQRYRVILGADAVQAVDKDQMKGARPARQVPVAQLQPVPLGVNVTSSISIANP